MAISSLIVAWNWCMILSSIAARVLSRWPYMHTENVSFHQQEQGYPGICTPCVIYAESGSTYIQSHIQIRSHTELRLAVQWSRNPLRQIRCRLLVRIRHSRRLALISRPPNRYSPTRPGPARQHDVATVQRDCWRLQLSKVLRSVARAYVQDKIKYKQTNGSARMCGYLT
jgi:hypothetical protein